MTTLFNRKSSLLLASVALANLSSSAFADVATATGASDGAKEVVVLGSRSSNRTVAKSAAPIDVLTPANLVNTGGSSTQLRDALATLVPSFKVDIGSNGAYNTFGRAAGLRGLSGAHVLVLVNGKRRHPSSIPLPANGQAPGANAIDLDQIPLSAIARVEILRDGAAAQYGSDAVSGVINIVLKSNTSGGDFNLLAGERYSFQGKNDGQQQQLRYGQGFKLPNDGFLTIGIDVLNQDFAFRAGEATVQIYPKINGQPDPREAVVERHIFRGGLAQVKAVYSSYNAELPIGDVTLYSYGTLGIRDIKNGQSYRIPNSTSVIPQLYSDVVQPTGRFPDKDFQVLGGAKGKAGSWDWDLSTTYGRHHAENGMQDTLNPSLGPTSPTTFRTFDAIFDQWTSNADIRRSFDVGFAEPLNVAIGTEYRHERYQTIVKDAAAYTNGGYIFPVGSPFAGQPAAIGAQGAITILPGDVADLKRNNAAAYIDLSTRPLSGWDIGAAVRYEHFDNSAGDVWVGKLTSRYELTPALAIRGTISNGFRAPSLTQEGFASASRGYSIVNGVITGLTTSRNVKPTSTAGIALGAKPLTPEKSVNLSGGFSFTPSSAFTLTVDGYAIWLKDRISQTGLLSGAGVNTILAANGLETGQSITYFTNAIDTKTTGVDIVSEYLQDLNGWAKVRWSLGVNLNETQITRIAPTPSQLAALNLTLFDRVAQGYIEVGNPKSKVIAGSKITRGRFTTNLTLQRYGSVRLLTTNAVNDQHYGAKWLTDLDVTFQATPAVGVSVGANNLFDVYPDNSTIADSSGSQLFASNSPFGYYGGYYYARLNVRF